MTRIVCLKNKRKEIRTIQYKKKNRPRFRGFSKLASLVN
jgi:hypothetical protein